VISFAKLDIERRNYNTPTIEEFRSLLSLQRARAQHRAQGLESMAQLFQILSFPTIKNSTCNDSFKYES
jgi:hypothetical protein